MEQCTIQNEHVSIGSRDVLTEILRHGAQEMLAQAIENEVAEYVETHAHAQDDQGRRLVVRNGYLPARTIRTGVGPVEIQQPRVNDKRIDEDGRRMRFSSTPTMARLLDNFEHLQRHVLLKGRTVIQQFAPEFKDVHRQLLDLLGLSCRAYQKSWQDHRQ